jgi:serine/threonine protein phosphatase PrpC
MPFEIAALTDVGRRRQENEDALEVLQLSDGALCTVADGMGGHQAGEVASHLAIEAIRQAFPADVRPAEASEILAGAIQSANRTVFKEAEADPAKRGMGTTVVSVLLAPGSAQLANVGDSPAFLVRGEQVERLTQDHSWVAEEIARGAITEVEAVSHPYRHILTRCLGMAEQVDVQVYQPRDLEPGDVIILCSDGLSEHVQPTELPGLVSGQSAQSAAQALIDLANARGGSDNITVVVARYE